MKKIIRVLLVIMIVSITALTLLACGGGGEPLATVTVDIQDGFTINKQSAYVFIKANNENIGVVLLSGTSFQTNEDFSMQSKAGDKITASVIMSCEYDLTNAKISIGETSTSVKSSNSWSNESLSYSPNLSNKYIYKTYNFEDISTKADATAIAVKVSGINPMSIANKTFVLHRTEVAEKVSEFIQFGDTTYNIVDDEAKVAGTGAYKYFSSFNFNSEDSFKYSVKDVDLEGKVTSESIDGKWTKEDGNYKLGTIEDGVTTNTINISFYWETENFKLGVTELFIKWQIDGKTPAENMICYYKLV